MYKLDTEMAEFCGVIMGDGNLWSNGRKYEVTITGSPKDRNYSDGIAQYARRCIKPNVYYRQRGRGLRLTIYSKEFYHFLTKRLGIKGGRGKCECTIPKDIAKSRALKFAFIRGFFDTDGSIFTSMKKGVERYPTMEITNENISLLLQIRDILEAEGFRTTVRKSNTNTFKIAIHGNAMVKRWSELIASSHPRKMAKMESVIKGFSIKENHHKPQ